MTRNPVAAVPSPAFPHALRRLVMTHDPDLLARARRAYERTISDDAPKDTLPPDPQGIARMERALRKLPRVTQRVFLTMRFDRKCYADIASLTGLSVAQVEQHISTAIAHLDRHYHLGPECLPRWRAWLARLLR
jgi:DNA-directed RNA polymerase specialized sigma24 family protein